MALAASACTCAASRLAATSPASSGAIRSVVGSPLKSGPKRPLKSCIPAPPLNHVSHTGTTDGVTCEAIPARIGTRICSRMSVAVPVGNGQQKVGGHADGIPPQRVEQASSPAPASMPPPSRRVLAQQRRRLLARREVGRQHARDRAVARGRLRRARPAARRGTCRTARPRR